MIGLDTNVLVRLLVNDDDVQHRRVKELLASVDRHNPAYISHIVLVETWWVLMRRYQAGSAVVVAAIEALLENDEVRLEQPQLVKQALAGVDAGADFADALIDAQHRYAGCAETASFDRAACRLLGWRRVD